MRPTQPGPTGVPAAPARRDEGCPTGPSAADRAVRARPGRRGSGRPGMARGAAGAERKKPTSEEGEELRRRSFPPG
jgi:hypothetical protein